MRKNKLFSPKNYILNVKKENILAGIVSINLCSCDGNSIKLRIEMKLEILKPEELINIEILFNSVWEKFFIQINKSQKPYNQKTLNYIPDYLKFATAPFIQELRRIMTSEKDKIFTGENEVLAEKITNTGNYVFKRSYNEEINTQIVNQINIINDLTVDVLNGIIHILLEKAKTPDLEVLFSIDDLLFIKGLKASRNKKGLRGGYKDSQRKEILEHLELLSNLKINVSSAYVPVIDGKGKRNYKIYSGESPIFYIKKAENKEYYFHVKAGEVLEMSLRGIASRTGLIHKKVAEYDHYRNFWEKRIGNYLAWIWRSRQNKADFLVPLSIETLLNQIGEKNKYKRPQALRNRLEDALYKLENDGVIKNWQYKNIDESVLTGKNWIQNWLKLNLIIEPPIEILEEYSKIKKINNNKTAKFDFQEIISIIKEKKLSQLIIAEETGIKSEVLSGILSGKKLPNTLEKKKLKNWITKQKG